MAWKPKGPKRVITEVILAHLQEDDEYDIHYFPNADPSLGHPTYIRVPKAKKIDPNTIGIYVIHNISRIDLFDMVIGRFSNMPTVKSTKQEACDISDGFEMESFFMDESRQNPTSDPEKSVVCGYIEDRTAWNAMVQVLNRENIQYTKVKNPKLLEVCDGRVFEIIEDHFRDDLGLTESEATKRFQEFQSRIDVAESRQGEMCVAYGNVTDDDDMKYLRENVFDGEGDSYYTQLI